MTPHPLADILLRLCLSSVEVTASAYQSPTARTKYYQRHATEAALTCVEVGERAIERGLDPLELIAVSYVESRHTRGLTSSAGAVGPLQALKRYWQRPGDQDTIEAGLRAWSYYRERSTCTREAAGKYNGGGGASAYALEVERHYDHLTRLSKIYLTHRGGAR